MITSNRHGVVRSVDELQKSIEAYIANHNQTPKLFLRTSSLII